jgi:DNA-binding response OmpR family regulator
MTVILIVDDEQTVLDILQQVLSPQYECLVATTVGKALSTLEDTPVELVITDISLPDRSGLELIGLVRQVQPHTPVIAISGINDVEYARGLLEMGAFAYLSKPFQLDEVTGTVDRAIQSRHRSLRPGGENDRRYAPRYELQAEAQMSGVLVFGGEEGAEDDMLMVMGYTCDISETGLGIVVPEGSVSEENVVGSSFHIVLGLSGGSVSIEAGAVRVRRLDDEGGLLIGARILSISGRDRVLYLQNLYLLSSGEL